MSPGVKLLKSASVQRWKVMKLITSLSFRTLPIFHPGSISTVIITKYSLWYDSLYKDFEIQAFKKFIHIGIWEINRLFNQFGNIRGLSKVKVNFKCLKTIYLLIFAMTGLTTHTTTTTTTSTYTVLINSQKPRNGRWVYNWYNVRKYTFKPPRLCTYCVLSFWVTETQL